MFRILSIVGLMIASFGSVYFLADEDQDLKYVNNIKSCTPACNWNSESSYHRYIMKSTSNQADYDVYAYASVAGTSNNDYEATAIAGGSMESETGPEPVEAHALSNEFHASTMNSLLEIV